MENKKNKRLTRRVDYDYDGQYGANGFSCVDTTKLQEVYDKLGKIEDIETEFDADFPTIIDALKNGVYTYGDDHTHIIRVPVTLVYDHGWAFEYVDERYCPGTRGTVWSFSSKGLKVHKK